MLQTWRWFGPNDPISLEHIAQTGAEGVVTSLHDIPTGDVWPLEAIEARKQMIEQHGLSWSVVESLPVHNAIKLGATQNNELIENYKSSLRHLSAAGIEVVCYNFMPVVDWTRTNLSFDLPNRAQALRFEMTDFVAYDVFLLQREGAEADYSSTLLSAAQARFEQMSTADQRQLESNIIAGLPGGEGSYGREEIRQAIAEFSALGTAGLRANLVAFLQAVVPVAEEVGIRLCIHPDDPPFSLFGLPRVVSTADDVIAILNASPSVNNGLTLCAGSFGARADNDLVAMVHQFGPHIHFVHLRNIKRELDGSFYESDHLDGDNDMVGLISALLAEEKRRRQEGRNDAIPMRPDHGHLMAGELNDARVNPGYSFTGRLKGLAELRGVIHALEQSQRQ